MNAPSLLLLCALLPLTACQRGAQTEPAPTEAAKATPPAEKPAPPAEEPSPPAEKASPPAEKASPPAEKASPPGDKAAPPEEKAAPPMPTRPGPPLAFARSRMLSPIPGLPSGGMRQGLTADGRVTGHGSEMWRSTPAGRMTGQGVLYVDMNAAGEVLYDGKPTGIVLEADHVTARTESGKTFEMRVVDGKFVLSGRNGKPMPADTHGDLKGWIVEEGCEGAVARTCALMLVIGTVLSYELDTLHGPME